MPSWKPPYCSSGLFCEAIGGKTLRCSHAVGMPFIIDGGLHVHGGRRVEVVELNVVFAAPDDLHRLADLLRKQRRFGDVIGFRLASEAAAQQRDVADDVVFA